jgi:hypothetical protein
LAVADNVYVWLALGAAVGFNTVVELKPVEGDHEYVNDPEDVVAEPAKATPLVPEQKLVAEPALTVGAGVTLTATATTEEAQPTPTQVSVIVPFPERVP